MKHQRKKIPVVHDIIALMEKIAPAYLAEEWDNSGLQFGNRGWPVKNIIVSLDPTPFVVEAACDKNADMLITHHPLIFHPLKNIVLDTPLGKIIDMSARRKLAIFSAHTNLDSVEGGLNDIFAGKIGLKNLTPLAPARETEVCKLVVYVPVESCQQVMDSIFETNAGIIDDYTCCTFRQTGTGTFKPGNSSRPFIGKPHKINSVDEMRIETRVPKTHITKIVSHIRKYHPYETMAYDIYPLYSRERLNGFGRIGELEKSMSLKALSETVKTKLQLETLKVSGPLSLKVKKIAVCTGSGSGLMKQFLASDADVYISGDLKYHDAKDSEIHYRSLIDVGHFASEKLMIDMLKQRLASLLAENGFDVNVEAFHHETDPFHYV